MDALRVERAITADDIAAAIGVSESHYYRMVGGHVRWTAERMVAAAVLLEVHPGRFFDPPETGARS